jgi:large subunit ribosomal protein L15
MLNELKPNHKTKTRKRVARGGKRGTYAGRGLKGQKSRSGSNKEPMVRGLLKRYPKLRGYKFNPKPKNFLEINFAFFEKYFQDKEKVNPAALLKKGIIRKIEKRIPRVKILGKGQITKALIIEDCKISKTAKEKIEKIGGKIKESK